MPKKSVKNRDSDPRNKRLRIEYGPHVRFLAPAVAAELAGVSVQTVYKWIAGTHPMDRRTRCVLFVRALGLLPHTAWRGWYIDETGRLMAPNGWSFTEGELCGLTLLKQLNGSLQATVARLTVENQQLRDAVDYLQGARLPGNVVRFPVAHKKGRQTPANGPTPNG